MAAALVVRHTFWEMELFEPALKTGWRNRALSDSVLDVADGFADQKHSCSSQAGDCPSEKSTLLPDSSSDVDASSEVGWTCSAGAWSDMSDDEQPLSTSRSASFSSTVSVPGSNVTDTTLILQKLPEDLTRNELLRFLDREGFKKRFNFVYLPTDFKRSVRCGYAIVNFLSNWDARQALSHFDNVSLCGRALTIEWSRAAQGVDALIQKYKNCALMHKSVDDTHRPTLLNYGKIIPFPCPTEAISPPPLVSRQAKSARICAKRSPCTVEKAPVNDKTTIVLRKLPKQMCRSDMQVVLDRAGFACSYDFLYVPVDFSRRVSFGYAIVNFASASHAEAAIAHFSEMPVLGQSLVAEWSNSQQGCVALVEKYRNNKVLHADVPEVYKPVILTNGRPVPFPRPTV